MIRTVAVSLSTALCLMFPAVALAQPTAPSATPIGATGATPDKAESAPSTSAKPPLRDDGASFQFHVGVIAPLGDFAKGVAVQDLVTSAYSGELRLAVYPTRHVGIMLGAAADAYSGACDDKKYCGGFGYRIPVGVELALDNRVVGPFATVNINVLSGVSVLMRDDSASFRANLREGELAVGWRIALPSRGMAFAPRLAFTMGEYNETKVSLVGARSVEGDIRPEARALHYGIALYAGYHFGS